MKTGFRLYSIICSGAMIILGSCELNSTIKTSPLPETLANFKTSEKLRQFEAAFPAYANQLQYDAYWTENVDGEEVFAIPSGENSKIRGVLYLNSGFKVVFETRAFNGPTATITIGDLTHDRSVTWAGKRVADHLYSFDLDPSNKLISGNASRQDYVDCVTKTYSTARNACYADALCTTMCDNLPTCKSSMLVAAAWTCIGV